MYASAIQICKLCYENNIEIILVNTPVHPGYYEKIPEIFFENHKKVYDYLQENFGAVYYDYSQFAIPDEGFGDGDHLNAVGAKIFTVEFAKVLKPLEE
jgi:lysophospholipase L1-like esterase